MFPAVYMLMLDGDLASCATSSKRPCLNPPLPLTPAQVQSQLTNAANQPETDGCWDLPFKLSNIHCTCKPDIIEDLYLFHWYKRYLQIGICSLYTSLPQL